MRSYCRGGCPHPPANYPHLFSGRCGHRPLQFKITRSIGCRGRACSSRNYTKQSGRREMGHPSLQHNVRVGNLVGNGFIHSVFAVRHKPPHPTILYRCMLYSVGNDLCVVPFCFAARHAGRALQCSTNARNTP